MIGVTVGSNSSHAPCSRTSMSEPLSVTMTSPSVKTACARRSGRAISRGHGGGRAEAHVGTAVGRVSGRGRSRMGHWHLGGVVRGAWKEGRTRCLRAWQWGGSGSRKLARRRGARLTVEIVSEEVGDVRAQLARSEIDGISGVDLRLEMAAAGGER